MILVATHRQQLGQECQANLQAHGFESVQVSGRGATSCSQLWNNCILTSTDEEVIICNEKARPKKWQIIKMRQLLAEGFGLVGLYRFGFFGFSKQLVREIGFFDERYLGGWFEDNDFILRLYEANIAYYESEECAYLQIASAWTHSGAKAHWVRKWEVRPDRVTRKLKEESYPYDLGPGTSGVCQWLPWSCGRLLDKSAGQWAVRSLLDES